MNANERNEVSLAVDEKEGECALSMEMKLQKLQEKTNLWKQSVAVQLNEAAKKNKQLRDELKAANTNHENEMAALRVQLNKEFRERTALKDEEILSLQGQLTELREEKRQMAERHEKDLQHTITRVRESCVAENAMQSEVDMQQLRLIIEQKEKDLLLADHELALTTARLERLGEQYRELSTLMTNSSERIFSDAGASNGETTYQHALKLSDAAHEQQLEAARQELRNLEDKNATKLREAHRVFEMERQQWVDERFRRDEQLATLQTLLRQTQHEATGAKQHIASVLVEKEHLEQRYFEKVATLSKDLASQIEKSETLSIEVERLQREVGRQSALLNSLEEEARMREEAFTSLMLSEESRALVQGLQASLQESRDETERWRCRYEDALLDARRVTSVSLRQDGEISVDVGGGDMEVGTSIELAKREEALVAEAARLELKAKMLKTMEARLEEIKHSVASQASVILQQQGVGNGNSSSRQRDVDKLWKERRGVTLPSSPRHGVQMMRDEQNGDFPSSLLRLASWFFLIRMRTALPLLLLPISLLLIFFSISRTAVSTKAVTIPD